MCLPQQHNAPFNCMPNKMHCCPPFAVLSRGYHRRILQCNVQKAISCAQLKSSPGSANENNNKTGTLWTYFYGYSFAWVYCWLDIWDPHHLRSRRHPIPTCIDLAHGHLNPAQHSWKHTKLASFLLVSTTNRDWKKISCEEILNKVSRFFILTS